MLIIVIYILALTSSVLSGSIEASPRSIEEGELGESLVLKWKITLDTAVENRLAFLVCLVNSVCIASGTKDSFTKESATVYTDRIQTAYDESFHVLTINKLNQSDDKVKLFAFATFQFGPKPVGTQKELPAVEISVVADPVFIEVLDSTLYRDENTRPTMKIIGFGMPKPSVLWSLGGVDALSVDLKSGNTGNDNEYYFNYTLPLLSKDHCNTTLAYSLSRTNGSTITNSSTLIIRFIPSVPSGFATNRVGETVVTASWDVISSGRCTVTYSIELIDNSNRVVEMFNTTTTTARFPFATEEASSNITEARIQAIFEGKSSTMEKSKVPQKEVPNTTPTAITPAPRSSDDNTAMIAGAVAGSILFIIIIVVIVVYVLKKKGNSGNKSRPNESRDYQMQPPATYDESDYAHVSKPTKPQSRAQDPDQILYAELGAGGGRTGPKPQPDQSNYAEVKVDEMGYPARGPTSDNHHATYSSVAMDKSRRHSPPPPDDDDFNEGVIV